MKKNFFFSFDSKNTISSPEENSETEIQSIFDRQREILEHIQTIEYQILLYQQELAPLKREKTHLDSLV